MLKVSFCSVRMKEHSNNLLKLQKQSGTKVRESEIKTIVLEKTMTHENAQITVLPVNYFYWQPNQVTSEGTEGDRKARNQHKH